MTKGKRWLQVYRMPEAVSMTLLVLLATVLTSVLSYNPAYAVDNDKGNGRYTALELGKSARFRVYATRGEFINFTVSPGERSGNAGDDCATISVKSSDGKTVLSNGGKEQSTCNNGTPTSVKVTYRVPNINIGNQSEAYTIDFDAGSDGDLIDAQDDAQGYEWRIWVSSDKAYGTHQEHGRVWFEGDRGLFTWQDTTGDKDLSKNMADFSFRYVRLDGYRYDMTYKGYQGIWSEFYGGIYGSARNDKDKTPAYTSFYKYFNKDPGLNIDGAKGANKAYVFVDCDSAEALVTCPNLPIFASEPITSTDANGKAGERNTGNPIPNENKDPNASSGFRYTGYNPAVNLAGGTVTIPYESMQSGYIRLKITLNGNTNNPLCQMDININDSDGRGSETWNFDTAGLKDCDTGTYKNTTNPYINPTSRLTISAQAVHLGEMHFITTDTERLGGVTIKGNGLSETRQRADKKSTSTDTWIVWYDPFNRSDGDVCGSAPSRVADGGGVYSGSTSWDSMSSGRARQPGGSIYTIGSRVAANSGAAADKWRLPTDSNVAGGVHGWKPASSGCNWTGDSSANGTAASNSTWGNKRNIENWAYAYVDPEAQEFTIGGSDYELTPTVGASSERLSANQPVTFSYKVAINRATSNTTSWSVRSVIIQPGVTLPSDYFNGFDGTGRTCASYYRSGAVVSNPARVTCQDAVATSGLSGSGTFPGTTINDENVSQSYPVGTRICRALVVDSYNQNAQPNARTSALTCAVVVVAPSVHVWGSDVRVGSGFVTGDYLSSKITATLTLANGNYKGSWVEYGALASSSITNFSSGSGLNAAAASSDPRTWSKLTFANKTLGSLGNFASSQNLGTIPDVKRYLIGAASQAELNLTQTSSDMTVGTYEGNRVYVVEGTVTITGDIINNSPRSGVSALTQMIIIADNINIAPNVKQIDAWLIAPVSTAANTGVINTCLLPGNDQRLSTNVCNVALKINGPLMADTVLPRRTSGEGKDPAEVYDLRGDAYIWARKISEANGSIHTTSIRELPPRY